MTDSCHPGLSCEPVKDTMSVCIHGVPVKLACNRCALEHKLNLIESTLKGHQKQINDVIAILVKGDSGLEDDIIKLQVKLEEMERYKSLVDVINENRKNWMYAGQIMDERFDELEKKIKKLKRFQDITHAQYINKKSPHKCPVCLNNPISEFKFFTNEDGKSKLILECHACEGKGVLWG